MKPDNDVLSKNASDVFPYENRELRYSIKKYIEYNGEEQPVTVYWDVEEYLYAGTYRVDIFAENPLHHQPIMRDVVRRGPRSAQPGQLPGIGHCP